MRIKSLSLSLSHIDISKMKIDERWIADRDRWKEDEGGLAARAAPNAQRQSTLTLTLTLTHEREHEEAAAVLCFVVSLLVLLYHHLSCSCALIHSYSLSRTSTLSLSQCCTLDSLLRITIACLDSLNQSIDILLLLLLLWSGE